MFSLPIRGQKAHTYSYWRETL
ncbi:hypothetical protein LEMLEM_LOCUS17137 [Lemmus lemmus]